MGWWFWQPHTDGTPVQRRTTNPHFTVWALWLLFCSWQQQYGTLGCEEASAFLVQGQRHGLLLTFILANLLTGVVNL
jgi:hypothetical protein